jgi:DNA-binding transcriptional ArsR family regulator
MPIPATIDRPTREQYRVSLEPVQNAIASMMLIAKEHDMPGPGTWLAEIREALTEDELSKHRLVIIGFFHAILPNHNWASFSDFLDGMEKSDPVALRDKMLDTYAEVCYACEEEVKLAGVNWDEVLSSPEAYVNFLNQRFGEDIVEVEMETRAYEYVIDPPAMQKLIVDHLRWFWNEHLSQEWARTEPLLRESVNAFQNVNLNNMNRLELVSYVTGQDIDDEKWENTLGSAEQVVFMPNPHIGPYVTRLYCEDRVIVVFGARQPEDASVRIPELDRADIVTRMSALADDTRLRILQMIAESGELRSREIKKEVGLSQPSVSRYLTQLTATGYLQERRVNGSKAYALNRDRIEKTLKAVRKFLLGS